jgi:hypothetical protein
MSSIISGVFGLHVHAGPDLMPRGADDLEPAQIIIKTGMAENDIRKMIVENPHIPFKLNFLRNNGGYK